MQLCETNGKTRDLSLPQNEGIERSLIHALIHDRDAWQGCTGALRADDFYHPHHRLIFSAVASLRQHADEIDVEIVAEELEWRGQLAEVGGIGAMVDIVSWVSGNKDALKSGDFRRRDSERKVPVLIWISRM